MPPLLLLAHNLDYGPLVPGIRVTSMGSGETFHSFCFFTEPSPSQQQPPPSQRQELCRQTHTQHTDTHTHLCSWMNQRQYIGRCHSQKKKLPWFPRRLCVFNKMRTKHRTLRKDLACPLLKTTSDHKSSPICYSASVLAFLSFLPFFCYPPPQDRVSLYSLVGLKLTR